MSRRTKKANTAADLETQVLGGVLVHGPDFADQLGIIGADFGSPDFERIYVWLRSNQDKWMPGVGCLPANTAALTAAGLLDHIEGAAGVITDMVTAKGNESLAIIEHAARQFLDASLERQMRKVTTRFDQGDITAAELADIVAKLEARRQGKDGSAKDEHLLSILDARRFDLDNPPPPTVPIYTLRDMAVATPGNLTVIQAPIKAGKTALLGAMLAAAVNPKAGEDMTLGVRSPGANGGAVIHFDCEQSPDDHHAVIVNALRRAGFEQQPAGLRSYCLTDVAAPLRREALRAELARAGDVFAVFLDGVADLAFSVNDEPEAIELVAELHALAIQHRCAIVTVLHENPGSEIGKTRGHLGSQLERKQFAGLRMAKDADEVTTLWTDRSRKASLPRAQGIRFAYDKTAGMHMPIDAESEGAGYGVDDVLRILEREGALTRGQLKKLLVDNHGGDVRTWEKRVYDAHRDRLIVTAGKPPKVTLTKNGKCRLDTAAEGEKTEDENAPF
jgi:hypothetical protein